MPSFPFFLFPHPFIPEWFKYFNLPNAPCARLNPTSAQALRRQLTSQLICLVCPAAYRSPQGKRIFIKDITHYLVPPNGKPASIAPSLHIPKRGVGTNGISNTNGTNGVSATTNGTNGTATTNGTTGSANNESPYPYPTEAEPGNPTVIPTDVLKEFHFAFLIRHPKYSIPSYYRCTIPPLDKITGFHHFMPEEAGYDEQRRVFDYLRNIGQIGPKIAGQETNGSNGTNGHSGSSEHGVEICVIDADDLLDNPSRVIETFCNSVGIEYSPDMLNWDNDEDHENAKAAFEKWKGFHEDAIDSTELKPRTHVSLFFFRQRDQPCAWLMIVKQKKAQKSDEQMYAEWAEKYGEEGAKLIQQTVKDNVADYEYLKQFAVKV